MSRDPFAVLGLGPDASLDELRSARRRLAAEFHPDRGGSEARMVEINTAFDLAMAELSQRGAPTTSATPQPQPGPPRHRQHRFVQRDEPSFTIDVLPVEAFEALLVVTSWIGEVLVDDPPYALEVHLHDPAPCWCRLDIVPDAGASTVTLTIAPVGDDPAPDVELVRDTWVALLNRL